jgi:hypothetical protein
MERSIIRDSHDPGLRCAPSRLRAPIGQQPNAAGKEHRANVPHAATQWELLGLIPKG